MRYRPEIDGLRAIAVLPVILFHAGVSVFSGGFVGVDIFFVISGYLITTILLNDIQQEKFSLIDFYERRARRILPALFVVLLVTTCASYFILYPNDFKEYGKSLISVVLFLSNIFFWQASDYFAVESELMPLLHTWSLSVEEQFYIAFPIILLVSWKYIKHRTLWLIAFFCLLSMLLSEWGWRNATVANFFLSPTRAWELLIGSFSAFILMHNKIKPNNILSTIGLISVVFSVFYYDSTVPFPSLFSLVPVLGSALIIIYAREGSYVAKALSYKGLVFIGLLSYSLYLWHQPVFALVRRFTGINMSVVEGALSMIAVSILSFITWRYVEGPFRDKNRFSRKQIFVSSFVASIITLLFSFFIIKTDGAEYRFGDLPLAPERWSEVPCHGATTIAKYDDYLSTCLGSTSNGKGGDIYLVGDSHAAQISFALREVASRRGVEFYFLNTENRSHYPYSFWAGNVENDPVLDYIIDNSDKGDLLVTSFHRGRLNNSRDSHINLDKNITDNNKSRLYESNMGMYLNKLIDHGLDVYFVKDGPLLSEKDNALEFCMDSFRNYGSHNCLIDYEQDDHTRKRQSAVFERLMSMHERVHLIDYLEFMYDGRDSFSPIDKDGEYLMFDRHHLTEKASMTLVPLFSEKLN